MITHNTRGRFFCVVKQRFVDSMHKNQQQLDNENNTKEPSPCVGPLVLWVENKERGVDCDEI
jgi:hypothetical protein